MSSQQMLNQLEQRLQRLAQALAPLAEQPAARSRFDRALFLTHGTRLKDYLQETRDNFTALQRAVGAGQRQQVAFLAERLLAQMAALQREQATQTLRRQEPQRAESAGDLYQELARHQDYERRLQTMVRERELRLAACQTLAQQQQIQRELAAMEGRLQRCRQALRRIEKQIERRENGFR
ncbi:MULTISPECIES: primosomal replication protein PriC [Edwardsiella]|uniref:Primosomal replication protein PriB and PriC n=2 Tax=Edwardsiella anguillarum TaxID=1821960 RepID=A0A076LLM6_9GAMM|nr:MULTISPECIES: primosomal replication protein [Edwardsiella]AKM48447.1 prephenate dehydrogenase [Edwardsiella sp. EA181011]GAJ66311.1 primosomal replication protein PriB and PriC [Edwardsiella piscicida]AIJ09390.1 Primosomal replication protein PriB and PriC [Edwardsiella anguillarum ET080813]KAB0590432.1 prephenate dehydrogenase [Edwardsiella anguillarum]MDA6075954.1 primosomal replication protein [Edwardsiella anguillarum]